MRYIVAFVLLCTCASAQQTRLTWSWQTPLPTGYTLYSVAAFATPPATIVLGEQQTILRSHGNNEWSAIPAAPSLLADVAYTSAGLLVGVGPAGAICTSTDNGDTWATQNTPLSADLTTIAFSGTTGVAAGESSSVIITTDGAATWQVRQLPGSEFRVLSSLAAPDGSLWLMTPQGRLYNTTDAGETWSTTQAPFTGSFTCFGISSNGTLMLGTNAMGLFRWPKGASFWEYATLPVNGTVTSIVAAHGDVVIATLSDGSVLRSDNDAATFNVGYRLPLSVIDAAFVPTHGIIAVGMQGLVATSTVDGATWSTRTDRSYDAVLSLASSGAGVAAAGCNNGTWLKRTVWEGAWAPGTRFTNHAITRMSMRHPDVMWAVTESADSNTFVSTNGGTTWRVVEFSGTPSPWKIDDVMAVSQTGAWARQQNVLLRTTDGGNTWTVCVVTIGGNQVDIGKTFWAVNESTAWVVGYLDQMLYRTTDGGLTWTAVSHAGIGEPLVFCAASASDLLTTTNASLNVSNDAGATWKRTPIQTRPGTSCDVFENTWTVCNAPDLHLRKDDGAWNTHEIPVGSDFASLADHASVTWDGKDRLLVSYGSSGILSAMVQAVSSVPGFESPTTHQTVRVTGALNGIAQRRSVTMGMTEFAVYTADGSYAGIVLARCTPAELNVEASPSLVRGIYLLVATSNSSDVGTICVY